MLKFVNKKGQKVLEVKDSGDITFVAEELKVKGLTETVESKEEKAQEEE